MRGMHVFLGGGCAVLGCECCRWRQGGVFLCAGCGGRGGREECGRRRCGFWDVSVVGGGRVVFFYAQDAAVGSAVFLCAGCTFFWAAAARFWDVSVVGGGRVVFFYVQDAAAGLCFFMRRTRRQRWQSGRGWRRCGFWGGRWLVGFGVFGERLSWSGIFLGY